MMHDAQHKLLLFKLGNFHNIQPRFTFLLLKVMFRLGATVTSIATLLIAVHCLCISHCSGIYI